MKDITPTLSAEEIRVKSGDGFSRRLRLTGIIPLDAAQSKAMNPLDPDTLKGHRETSRAALGAPAPASNEIMAQRNLAAFNAQVESHATGLAAAEAHAAQERCLLAFVEGRIAPALMEAYTPAVEWECEINRKAGRESIAFEWVWPAKE